MLLAVLHFIADEEHPGQITAALMDAVVPGSYLTISAVTNDIGTEPGDPGGPRLQYPAGRGPDAPPDARGRCPGSSPGWT